MDFKELELAGVDLADLKNRLMGNEKLIRMLIGKFVEDSTLPKLEQAIHDGDYEAATAHSHSLKGVCGNLSVTTLYEMFYNQLTLFRSGENEKAVAMMDEILPTYRDSIAHMKHWLEQQ